MGCFAVRSSAPAGLQRPPTFQTPILALDSSSYSRQISLTVGDLPKAQQATRHNRRYGHLPSLKPKAAAGTSIFYFLSLLLCFLVASGCFPFLVFLLIVLPVSIAVVNFLGFVTFVFLLLSLLLCFLVSRCCPFLVFSFFLFPTLLMLSLLCVFLFFFLLKK